MEENNKKMVSVIIPVYNSEEFLGRTIESVLSQTYDNIEIIIVNDASTDNTENIVKKLQNKDQRIKYLKFHSNRGVVAARNEGIKEAQGRFIALLDSDDEWFPRKLEKQLNIFENSTSSDLGFVGCNQIERVLDDNDNIVKERELYKKSFSFDKKNFTLEDFLNLNFPINSSNVLIKNEALSDVGYLDEKFVVHEDFDLWIRLRAKYDFETTWEPLARYYNRQSSLSKRTPSLQKIESKKYLLEKHKELYDKYPLTRSRILRNIGSEYMLAGNKKKATAHFMKAIKNRPLAMRNYLNLFVSVLGVKVYKRILLRKRM